MASEAGPRSFELKSSETQFQSFFEEPCFDWLENWTRLSGSIFATLRPHGLRLADIKLDAAGSLADFQLTASLLRHSTIVRIRLDSVEVHCYNPATTTTDRIDTVVVSILEGLQQHNPELKIGSMTCAISLHGIVAGESALDFLSEFSGSGHVELGRPNGVGSALYFGESERRTSAVLTLDRSAQIADAVYIRLNGVWNGSAVTPSELPELTSQFVSEAFAQLKLTLT